MSTLDDCARGFLIDLCRLVRENAIEAKGVSEAAFPSSRAYELGRLMAYHEVVSLIQQQAVAFGIDVRELGLDVIVPERDLV